MRGTGTNRRQTRRVRHLLVTNDFPPKIGGIQSYLWELWRRLPADDVTVFTTPYDGDVEFDAAQAFRVVRCKERWMLPTQSLARRINALAAEVDAELIILDPALPLGLLGRKLDRPYVFIAHGAEWVIPLRLPLTRAFARSVARRSVGAIAGGAYVADFISKIPSMRQKAIVSVPPGVDTERFTPMDSDARIAARNRLGLPPDGLLVLGVSRLVPRKGFDRLIKAAAELKQSHDSFQVVIAGSGRERKRLDELISELDAPVTMLGRVPDADLPDLYGSADLFCMPCHDRWMGFETEGFGIVFVEAAAAGLPVVAGSSGGSGEAVEDGQSGLLVGGKVAGVDVASALGSLLEDSASRTSMAENARKRAVEQFDYDLLAERLREYLESFAGPSAF